MPWTPVGSLNRARQGLAVATAPAPSLAGRAALYAVGGDEGTASPVAVGEVEMLDPSTGNWSASGATLPSARTDLAAAALAGQLHVVGGTAPGPVPNPQKTHNIFDPIAATWSTPSGGPLNTARSSHAVVAGPDGHLYAIGGLGSGGSTDFLNSLEIYNPVTESWASGPNMPTARAWLGACLLGQYIYVIGGQNSTSNALETVRCPTPCPVSGGRDRIFPPAAPG